MPQIMARVTRFASDFGKGLWKFTLSLPRQVLVFMVYAAVALPLGGAIMDTVLVPMPLLHEGIIPLTLGNFFVFASVVVLFIEIMKSTNYTDAVVRDHNYSMLLLLLCLVLLAAVPAFGTITFLDFTVLLLADVLLGYNVTQAVAGRSLQLGNLTGGN